MAKKTAIKQNLSYTTIKLSDNIPAYPTFKFDNRNGYIKYGKDNKFPQFLLDLNSKSAINNAIIQSKITYALGNGVDTTAYVGKPNLREDWNTFLEKIFTDYITFGSFSFQVILNEDDETVSLFHQDYSTVRCGEYDENGNINEYYLSNDFSKSRIEPLMLLAWNSEIPKKGVPYLYVYNTYSPNLLYYSLPDYYGALNYIDADGILGNFYNNSINNNFTPSSIIMMPSNPSEEEKIAFQQSITGTFSGAENSNNIMVMWNQSVDNQMKIESFSSSNNADLYNNINDIIFQKIVTAHRLSSPVLAGVSGSGNLSGNANEIINAYILFNYTVIQSYRVKVLNVINEFVRRNYNGKELIIKELPIIDKIKESETTQDAEDIIKDALNNRNKKNI